MLSKNELKIRGDLVEDRIEIEEIAFGFYPEAPMEFLDELEYFCNNNTTQVIVETEGEKIVWEFVCLRCLKAHAIRVAGEMGFQGSTLKFINKSVKGEIGHDGYYLNRNKLIKIAENPIIH